MLLEGSLTSIPKKAQYTTKSRPSLACKCNTILMEFHWQANDGPPFNAD